MTDNCDVSVRVAVRVRPLVASEIARGCREILDVVEDNEQIVVRSVSKEDKAFTYNYVLSSQSQQSDLYNRCVQPLIGNLFKGYNVTIMAYGQTGSGKTHSMGTAYTGDEEMGVIPKTINEIFTTIRDHFTIDFDVSVSFLELYQEVLYDLLSGKPREQCMVELREDPIKGIVIPGLSEIPVKTVEQVLTVLKRGSAGRATGCTAMNSHSSRSHAVFTINLSMTSKENQKEHKTAKLHLVDLAGSERAKKTNAEGSTFKEGVLINKGLMVLGNVISALGDPLTKHIPYRDSNLTRLLKDSLGGNSITLMVACVSPADYNMDETISTLRYADRARKIKNKPVVNQDARVAEINELKKTVQQLRLQILGQGGPMVCPAEIELLRKEILEAKAKIRELTVHLSAVLLENTGLHEKIAILQNANEALSEKIGALKRQYDATFRDIGSALQQNDAVGVRESVEKLQLIQSRFADIDRETRKTELEIKDHEEFFCKTAINASDVGESSKEIQTKHETHTTRQMSLNQQLLEIQQQLAMKESLAKQLTTNNQYMVDYQALTEHETKIANLEKEKEDLLKKLKDLGSSGKISEQHKKRMQELEAQLLVLKKKVQEHARLIKLKDKDELRIAKLNQDILQMKQAKVKLVRTMREESDKFRQWKVRKERECQRLQQQDRKKDNEIVKMKVMHDKQQVVFKARVEQAEAVNKRLKSLLQLRQQALDAKNAGRTDKIDPWLKREYNLYMNLVEAEATLNVLLDDRATLQQQLNELKRNSDDNADECKNIEDDLELRSVQIQDLQQKLSDSEEERKSKPLWEKFQSVGEAKVGLKFLCLQAAEEHREKMAMQTQLGEWEEAHNEAQREIEQLRKCCKEKDEKGAQQLVDLQQEYEEKIAILLRQMRGSSDEKDEAPMFAIHQTKIEQLEGQVLALEEENKKLLDNNKALSEKMIYIEQLSQEHKNSVFTPLPVKKKKILQEHSPNAESCTPKIEANETFVKIEQPSQDMLTPVPVQKKQTVKKKSPKSESCNPKVQVNDETFVKIEGVLDESIIEEQDDVENDPDWRQTPLAKRLMEQKKKFTFVDYKEAQNNVTAPKRSSDGGCTCKTKCTSGRCGCKRLGKTCSAYCKCNACENQGEASSRESTDDVFKAPDIDELPKKKPKKTRRLFE